MGGGGGAHRATLDMSGLHEYPQCPLLAEEMHRVKLSFDKRNAEQESWFRKQVFTSIKNDILVRPVIDLPCASASLGVGWRT